MRCMSFEMSERAQSLATRVSAFMDEHIYPNERRFREQIAEGDRWQPVPIIEDLKHRARAAGLWNLFLPESELGRGLRNAVPRSARSWGARRLAPSLNCSAPDTGNMEVLVRYATPAQRREWLEPLWPETSALLRDDRTEVASSDAITPVADRASGDDYISTAASGSFPAPVIHRRIAIFMGRSNPDAAPPAAVDDPRPAGSPAADSPHAASLRLRRCRMDMPRSRWRMSGSGQQYAAR
jgi:acyl-CoA dehydrogenase